MLDDGGGDGGGGVFSFTKVANRISYIQPMYAVKGTCSLQVVTPSLCDVSRPVCSCSVPRAPCPERAYHSSRLGMYIPM